MATPSDWCREEPALGGGVTETLTRKRPLLFRGLHRDKAEQNKQSNSSLMTTFVVVVFVVAFVIAVVCIVGRDRGRASRGWLYFAALQNENM